MAAKKKSSWITTFFGTLAGMASAAAIVIPDPKAKTIAGIVAAIATGALGYNAASVSHVQAVDQQNNDKPK